MAFTKIDSVKLNSRGATTLDNKPQISATKLKEEFDAPAKQIVAPALNNLIDELEDPNGASSLGAIDPMDSSVSSVQALINRANVDISALETDKHSHPNKEVLDTITEDVVMDADYVHTDNNYTDADKDLVQSAVQDSNYVHTDNNYTNSEKNKLATVDDYANNYVLPVADNITLGGVKPDGTTTKVDADGTIHVIGGGGGGTSDAYKTVRVGTTDIIASGEDTLQLVQGANVTLTPDPVTKKVTISATGGSGGGGGDMYMAVYDTDEDGIVNSADTLNGLTATVPELNFVGGARSNVQSQLDALSTTVNTKADKTVTSGLRTDVDALIDKAQNLDNNGKISASNVLDTDGVTPITDKLSVLDNVADTPQEIETATVDGLASTLAIQKYSNTYVEKVTIPVHVTENNLVDGGGVLIGNWQDEDFSKWTPQTDGKDNFIFCDAFYDDDSDPTHDIKIDFSFDTENGQMIYYGGHQLWTNPTNTDGTPFKKDGKLVGGLVLFLANVPDEDINVIVEITHTHVEERRVVFNG